MPKKGKGKKGKGKGKKGKGKKGSKSGKKSKPGRDLELASALENAKLFSTRLETTEKARNEYRETCKKLAVDNEKLHSTLYQSEKDTIDVVKFLKKGDMAKDEQLANLQQQIRDLKKQTRKDKEKIILDFNEQISSLESNLEQRNSEVQLMQSELKLVKEFRKKRAEMQNELDEIRESLFYAHKDHKDTMQKLEHKFFEEKIRLEREASHKIAELAERAQAEALTNLDETTKSVYIENVKLNESLREHISSSRLLQMRNHALNLEVEDLRWVLELNNATVKRKNFESRKRKQEIRNLKEKVTDLEKGLSSMVQEFREEKLQLELKSSHVTASSEEEISKLQEILRIQDEELCQVKSVAKKIVQQRTSVEVFFLDALEKVRVEIVLNRRQYVDAARNAYHQKMREAYAGQGEFPQVRTFSKNENSTNSVYSDLKEAENWSALGNKVDIGDLTWEQKEKVLRLLYARMNGLNRALKPCRPPISSAPQSLRSIAKISSSNRKVVDPVEKEPLADGDKSTTFITQQETSLALPSIAT